VIVTAHTSKHKTALLFNIFFKKNRNKYLKSCHKNILRIKGILGGVESYLAYFDDIDYTEMVTFRSGFEISDEEVRRFLVDVALS
jgi:hypothetical protein